MARPAKRVYSSEFKLVLVERFLAGESASGLAAEADLSSPLLLKTWARVYRREGPDGLRPKPAGRPRNPDAPALKELSEVERLRRENERLRAEVAYLGKVRALKAQPRR
jgi:transposase